MVPCEHMKNEIGVIILYMQPGLLFPVKTWKKMNSDYYALYATRGLCALWIHENKIGVIMPYMHLGVIILCEDIKNEIGVILPSM